jgi:hypothetical protein
MKVGDEVKTVSAATIAGASTPEEKLEKLFGNLPRKDQEHQRRRVGVDS